MGDLWQQIGEQRMEIDEGDIEWRGRGIRERDSLAMTCYVLGPIVAGQDHWGHLSMRVGVPGEDSWRRSTASPTSDVCVNNSFSQSFRFGSQTLIQYFRLLQIQGLVVLVEELPKSHLSLWLKTPQTE